MCLNPDCAWDRHGVVYILHAIGTDFYKIGMSTDLDKRLKDIQICCPLKLEVVATFQRKNPYGLERSFHDRLFKKCIHGEWFHLEASDLQELIKDVAFVPQEYRLSCGRWKKSALEKLCSD